MLPKHSGRVKSCEFLLGKLPLAVTMSLGAQGGHIYARDTTLDSRSHAKFKEDICSTLLTTHPSFQGCMSDKVTVPLRVNVKNLLPSPWNHRYTLVSIITPTEETLMSFHMLSVDRSVPDLCRNHFYSGKRGAGLLRSNIC